MTWVMDIRHPPHHSVNSSIELSSLLYFLFDATQHVSFYILIKEYKTAASGINGTGKIQLVQPIMMSSVTQWPSEKMKVEQNLA